MGNLTNRYGGGIVLPVGIGVSLLGIILVSTFPRATQALTHNIGVDLQKAANFREFIQGNWRFTALIGSIALLFFSPALINTYAIQIIQNVGGGNVDLGIASAIGGFLELPAMAIFPLLIRRNWDPGTLLKWSGVFLVLKTLLTLLAPNVGWFYVAQSLQFFAFAMFIPASVYYVNQVIRDVDKVKGQVGMTIALGMSGMIGNFFGGFMLDTSGGVRLMLTVGLGVSLIGLILVLMFVERPKIQQPAI